MMKTLKKDWLYWIILMIPFIFIALFWDRFPEQIPTHFNLQGEPDSYSGKAVGLFLLPGINMGMYFLFKALPFLDPKGKNYALFLDKLRIIQLILHVFFLFVFFIIAFYSLGLSMNTELPLLYGLLVLFLVLGNYMGNIRHNYFVGIRTPWTLANDEVWLRTHRLAARIWVIASLIMMVALPFLPQREIAFGIFICVITLIPIVYSFIIFKKIKHEN